MSDTSQLDVLFIRPGGSGWGPVTELVGLIERLLEARVVEVGDRGEVSALRKAAALLPRGRRGRGRHLLVVAANPAAVAYLARPALWWPGYDSVACWVIDSFWTDRTPRILRSRPHIDRLFTTDPGLVNEWSGITALPVTCLPWGADTTRFPEVGDRPIDVLRLGRQPEAWDDDAVTARDAEHRGLRFAGRPPMSEDPFENQSAVRRALLSSKIVLAFSNLVSPAAYTHPTRDYLTGRWMDALAAGCLVAGRAPAAATSQLWDGATIEIDPTSREASWTALSAAVAAWSPARAQRTQTLARERLDWRLRLHDLCRAMCWNVPPQLSAEIATLPVSPLGRGDRTH